MKENPTSWGKVANWYDGMITSLDTYQSKVILPNLLRLVDAKAKEKILDIACGQGFFAHEIGKSGAEVDGIDISKELIAIAKKDAKKNERYTVGSADEKLSFKDKTYDKAFSVLALQNIKDINKTFEETARVLKDKGKFIFVINHPTFRIPQGSDWGFDEEKKGQFRKVYEYMSEKTVSIVMNPGKKNSEKTISFHRPLQVYSKHLLKNGFAITKIEEWLSHKESQKGPRQVAEDKARKEIPMFMMIECRKI